MKIIQLTKILLLIAALLNLNCLPVQAARAGQGGDVKSPQTPAALVLPSGSSGSGTINIVETAIAPEDNPHGAFRVDCKFSHANYDDPIIYPNRPGASHLHFYFGNTKTNASSTTESVIKEGNSTCSGGVANRSSYWIPAMLNSLGNPVPPTEFFVYYKSRNDISQLQSPPRGIQLVVGDRVSTVAQPVSKVTWECYAPTTRSKGVPACKAGTCSLPKTTYFVGNHIPNCKAGNVLRHTLHFPLCWDGVNLSSADYQSHTSEVVRGKCPASHPVEIPRISYKMTWFLKEDSGKWRLSSDNYDKSLPGGYSAHGDWMEGWVPEIKQLWFKNCTAGYKDCGVGNLGNGTALAKPV